MSQMFAAETSKPFGDSHLKYGPWLECWIRWRRREPSNSIVAHMLPGFSLSCHTTCAAILGGIPTHGSSLCLPYWTSLTGLNLNWRCRAQRSNQHVQTVEMHSER